MANPESFRKQLLTALTRWYPPSVKERLLKKLISYSLAKTKKPPNFLELEGFLASILVAGVGSIPN